MAQSMANRLLRELMADSGQSEEVLMYMDEAEKKDIIRSLMNTRMPGAVSKELLQLQDDYLQEQLAEKGIVTLSDIPTIREQFGSTASFGNIISLWQGDITRLKVGAIVNAANSQMLGCFVPCHRCIDNAIHSAAGMQLREECSHIMNRRRIQYGKKYEEPTGTATLTFSYNLPCDYVIHTVGPIVSIRSRIPSVITSIRVEEETLESKRTRYPTLCPTLSPSIVAIRSATCLAAILRGSSISILPSGRVSSRTSGRSVDLPAPGGAVTTRRGCSFSDAQTSSAISAIGNSSYFISSRILLLGRGLNGADGAETSFGRGG